MKSSILELTLIVLLFSVCGCTKTEIITDMEQGIPPKKTVTLDVKVNDEKTKTALGEKQDNGSYSMIWSEGDEIAVINNSRLFKFTINAEDAGAVFTINNFAISAGITSIAFDWGEFSLGFGVRF